MAESSAEKYVSGQALLNPQGTEALLAAIMAALQSLTYLRAVVILDDELLPPEEIGFPLVGVKDADEENDPRGYAKDSEIVRVRVTAYQSVLLDTPGASVMGEASLGDAGKGVIQIGKDIKNLLHKNKLGLGGYYLARYKSAEASQTILSSETARYAQKKTLLFEYVRSLNA